MKKIFSKILIFLPIVVTIVGSIIYREASLQAARTFLYEFRIIAAITMILSCASIQATVIWIAINITKEKATKIIITLLSVALGLAMILMIPTFILTFRIFVHIDSTMATITATAY